MIGSNKKNLLLMVSGSIAAYKSCELISTWRQAGHAVRVMTTPSAENFIGMATLEGLSGHPVLNDTFASGQAMAHIDWVRWADVIVLCPATANRLTALYQGRADDLVGTALLAAEPGLPIAVIPAMNTRMWHHPTVQTAVNGLKQRGIAVMPPSSGALACGETGEGRLPAIADVLDFVEKRYLNPAGKRILITAGGTTETIDAVRVLTNRSSGRTGAALADHLAAAGHQVTLLRAQTAARPRWPVAEITFTDFANLHNRLQQQLKQHAFDVVIHAAAISDYSLQALCVDGESAMPAGQHGKLDSEASQLSIHLKRNPKLVDAIKGWSCCRATQLVAFKLTACHDPAKQHAAVKKLLRRSGADWVVHNDQIEIDAGDHVFRLYDKNTALVAECGHVTDLAETLMNVCVPPGQPTDSSIPSEATHDFVS